MRGYGVRISGADDGSLWLVGAIGELTLFLVEATLGETLPEAWKDSEPHKAQL